MLASFLHLYVSLEMETLPLLHFNLLMKLWNLWLLFVVSVACFSSYCGACEAEPFICGERQFGYPFGRMYNSCGNPLLQLQCDYAHDPHMPLLDINGTQFYIMQPSNFSYNITEFEGIVMTIFDKNSMGKKCDSSLSYSINFPPGDQLQIVSGFKKINPWIRCQDGTSESGCEASYCSFNIKWMPSSSCKQCHLDEGVCVYNKTSKQLFCEHGDKSSNNSNNKAVLLGLAAGVVVLLMVAALLVFFFLKRASSSVSKVEKFLQDFTHEMPTRYSYSQLKKITNNLAEKLGEGGFGVVYKGKLSNGNLVAVKILDHSRQSETQFMNEVTTIGRIHHLHVVRLMGYCFEGFRSALVYEYMVNGSLEKFVFMEKEKRHILSWEQLYSIALGAARGITYLHEDCERRVIHFDIKPHNILLDADYTPKVSDFGLAKLCGRLNDHISITVARGTPGYVAPELWSRNLGPITDKADVYSFGMMLLEIVGGRKNIDVQVNRSSQLYFPDWAFKLLEKGELEERLRGQMRVEIGFENEMQLMRLCKIGLWCIQYNSMDRPRMSKVVQMLEGNGDEVSNPPFPFDSSPSPQAPFLSSVDESSPM